MKRDLDLIRKILLTCEESPHGYAPGRLAIPGYSEEQVGFHVHLMMQAGLVDGADASGLGSESPSAIATSVTWDGYEFLEASKNEDTWSKAKGAAKAAGGMTLEVVKALLVSLATRAANSALGLP